MTKNCYFFKMMSLFVFLEKTQNPPLWLASDRHHPLGEPTQNSAKLRNTSILGGVWKLMTKNSTFSKMSLFLFLENTLFLACPKKSISPLSKFSKKSRKIFRFWNPCNESEKYRLKTVLFQKWCLFLFFWKKTQNPPLWLASDRHPPPWGNLPKTPQNSATLPSWGESEN